MLLFSEFQMWNNLCAVICLLDLNDFALIKI